MDLKAEQWKLTGDIVIILEPFSIVTTFFSYEENISTSSVFTILHGLLDKLEPNEDSGSDLKIINDFNNTVASQILHRFELQSLYTAHPFLIWSLPDPHSKVLNFSSLRKRIPKL